MPIWKTTRDILKTPDQDELFDQNLFMDTAILYEPPTTPWNSKREPQIEDIDIWEIIIDANELSIFAAWAPYAEFYLVVYGYPVTNFETYYGPGSQRKMREIMTLHGFTWGERKIWVKNEDVPYYI